MSVLPFVLGGASVLDWLGGNQEEKYLRGINDKGISYLQKVMSGGDGFNPVVAANATRNAIQPQVDEQGRRIDENLGLNTGRGAKLLADSLIAPEMDAFNDAYNRKHQSALQAALALAGYGR